jgi:hypothetical protein
MNLIGDIRQYLGQDLAEVLKRVIEQKKDVSKYFILVVTKNDPMNLAIIRTTIQLHSRKPPKMLGTMCFEVSNRKSYAKRLWVLPLDIPHTAVFEQEGDVNNKILKKAHQMPILH